MLVRSNRGRNRLPFSLFRRMRQAFSQGNEFSGPGTRDVAAIARDPNLSAPEFRTLALGPTGSRGQLARRRATPSKYCEETLRALSRSSGKRRPTEARDPRRVDADQSAPGSPVIVLFTESSNKAAP